MWVATSSTLSGFALEHSSLDALVERVKIAIPDFIAELNGDVQDF